MTALDASPSERRIAQHMEASDASRTCPSYYADASPRLGAATAHRSPGASSQRPEHQKKSESTNGCCSEAPGSANAFARFARKRRPCRKRQGKKRSRTLLMRKSEEEGPLSALTPEKACGSVSETPGEPLFLHCPRQWRKTAPCARLRRISEPRALHAPEGKDAPPLPRNADAAPFRCFCRRLRPRCRQ